METTSVPRWGMGTTGTADSGRYVTVLSFGAAAEPRARALVTGLSGRRVSWLRMPPGWTSGAQAVLGRELAAARVGWRLALVGDEVTVLQARACAVEAGALSEEILADVVGVDLRRVYCAHCHRIHATGAVVGGTSACPSCGTNLMIHHHVSRLRSAYLGYLYDAEECR
ncbi:dimethylamine monooxygenase subunit DmmA family protein [Rhodococcus sp. OK519]|uniref:dimethylamine monooxygenase subunit DmmA family protein n=1 Tax=Rhodococcus sp. OK519 TaxID=2135729 RepID=UPI000D38B661